MIYSKDYQYISKRTRQIWANVWMLLTPVILFLMMEHINNPYGNLNIGLKYWIINVAILEIIFIFFYYVPNSLLADFICTSILIRHGRNS